MPVEIDDAGFARTATLAATAAPPRADTTELPVDLRLGHFKIDKKLGAGGMGEVYLATDVALDRPVAIKVLPASSTSGVARDRLIREARAQARIQHPNVAHIYFIGEEAGRLYFAMEYLSGQTLAERVASGPLSVEEALAVIRAAALGLREAQRAGFLHRDVKPSNLMADAHGVVKVLDFGLVAATSDGGDDDVVAHGSVAQTSLAGTPLYMAPEQAKAQTIDLRADIYALGATLFHLVSGNPPFVADTLEGLISQHASAARPHLPRKGQRRPEIAAIDALVARMMAPDPADRFASYDDLIRELDLVSTVQSRPAGAWVRSIASGIDLLLVTLLAALVALPFGSANIDGYIANVLAFAYGTMLLARWGTTAGKALLELEVVSITTSQRPTLTQAFVREVTMLGPTMGLAYSKHALGAGTVADVLEAASLIVFGLTVVALFHAAWRVPGKRAPWDRVAGTQVRYRVSRRAATPLLP